MKSALEFYNASYKVPMDLDNYNETTPCSTCLNVSSATVILPVPVDNKLLLYRYIISVYITGILCTFGLFGNIMAFITLWKDKRKLTTLYFLGALALADSGVLVMALLILVPTEVCGNYVIHEADCSTSILIGLNYWAWPLALSFQTAAVWLVVLVTFERFIAICFPFKSRHICTLKRARIAIACVIILAIAYNIPRYFYYKFEQAVDPFTNHTSIQVSQELLQSSTLFRDIYSIGSYFVFILFGPSILLAGLNTKLILALRKAQRERRALVRRLHHGEEKHEHSITKVLVVVVLVFIVCQAPAMVSQGFLVNLDSLDDSWKLVDAYLHLLTNLLVFINSSINPIIYCLCSKRFRQDVSGLFCGKGIKKSNQNGLTTHNTELF